MKICRTCQGKRIVNGKAKKKAKADPPPKAPTSTPIKNTSNHPGDEKAKDEKPWLMIDLAGHKSLFDRICEQAEQELRTPEMQALFLLRKSLNP